MKNLIITLLGACLFLLGACNQIDAELMDNLQSNLNKVQDTRPAMEESAQQVVNLYEQMKKAPEGLKNNPEFSYLELLNMVDRINTRYQTIFKEQEAVKNELETLMADYSDGKVKKPAVEEALKALKPRVESLQKVPENMAPRFDQCSTEFAKMTASYAALPESEKNPTAKNPNAAIKIGTPATQFSPNAPGARQPGAEKKADQKQ